MPEGSRGRAGGFGEECGNAIPSVLLPDEAAPLDEMMMGHGLKAAKDTLERAVIRG